MTNNNDHTPVKTSGKNPHIHFTIQQTEHGNYLVIGYIGDKEGYRNCLGNHRNALNAGNRWKKRVLRR